MQTPSALPWQIARAIEFVAIVVGMAAVIFEFWFERPRDRELRDVQLHATVAELATRGNVNETSHAVQRILELMHRDGVDMSGISIPKVTIRMAEFENADWSNAYMNAVNFACTQSILDALAATDRQNTPKDPILCAHLSRARFNGANLRAARFQRANLSNAGFTGADLTEAEFHRADLSHTRLFRARLTAIKARDVNFSHSRFRSDDDRGIAASWLRPWLFRDSLFDCTTSSTNSMKCVSLERALFIQAEMPHAAFLGAKIINVDFAGATLHNARFACHKWDASSKDCTEVVNACFNDANLSNATFQAVTIKNSDFSDAELDNATFENVIFDNVVFSDKQKKEAKFDDASIESLNASVTDSSSTGDSDQSPCEAPWRRTLLPPYGVPTTSASATYP